MNRKAKMATSLVLLVLFLVLIAVLQRVDVAAVGPAGTQVGLSGINTEVHGWTGLNMTWYKITKYLGYLTLLAAAALGLYGAYRLVRDRDLQGVNRALLGLGILYLVTAVFYVLFEKVAVNYRPELMPGASEPEASFPSTHTLLAVVIMGSAVPLLGRLIRDKRICRAAQCAAWAVLVLTVAGRLLSGVHWLTDILGGLLLGTALVLAWSAAVWKKD